MICCLTCLVFLKSSWWSVWTFSAETHLNFQINLPKVKTRKEHKKIFCGLSKVLKNISWPIKICLKIFHDPCKNPLVPPPTYLMYGPLSKIFFDYQSHANFVCRLFFLKEIISMFQHTSYILLFQCYFLKERSNVTARNMRICMSERNSA